MSTYFRLVRSGLILLSLLHAVGRIHAEEQDRTSTLDELAELEAFLAETDRFLEETADPFAELMDLAESPYYWSVSLRAGAGYSTNFLKRQEAVSSPYITAETDAFLNALFTSSSLTALLYMETAWFDENSDVDQEAVLFLHANWTGIRPTFSFGTEVDVFFGDQIYDASLEDSIEPTGNSLKQFRPEISIFWDWDAGELDSLKVTLSLQRSMVFDEDEDYWRPAVALEWNRVWSGSIGSRTELTLYQEIHDDDLRKTSTGINREPGGKLRIDGLQLEEVVSWKPVRWESFSATVRMGVACEEDPDDDYHSLSRIWAGLGTGLDLDSTKLNLRATWQGTSYEDREVSSRDERHVKQRHRTLEFEVEQQLTRTLSITGSLEWSEFTSHVQRDSFSERRIQALIDWTY